MSADVSIFEPPAHLTQAQVDRFNRTWSAPSGFLGTLRTINNIPVAQRYMITGFLFFLFGGALALLMRIQLGSPENTFLDPETYNQLFTMHGTTMMFLFVIPFIEAVANYILPLLLGTRDMPFPRLTALSYWTYVFGGIFLYSSFLFGVAPDGGWFAYVPLTNKEFAPAINMDYWDIGLSVAEVAAMGAAAELIVAILRMRAPGMSLSRMPLFCWSMLVTAIMIIFAFTPLIVGTAMLELDRKMLTSFFKPEAGGEPLLWQHLFWVFGHPEVYIMFIPAVGIVSHVVQTFSRRPIVGYPFMVAAIVSTGFLSFGLWVHHMFAAGISPAATSFFTATSMVIAIPAGVQIFSWLATMWLGRPIWRTPLLFVVGFIVIFTVGGLTGVMLAAVPFNQQTHDTFFVVAHFHYVLIGGVVFPLFAGLYYWLPKVTGRLLSEKLGRWNFWLMFIFFNVAFFPMHVSGMLGMPRRVYTYSTELGVDSYNLMSTIGAFGFAAGVLLFVGNLIWSLRHGQAAGSNPWSSDSLEWSQSSPPAQAQFQAIPAVSSRHPLWEQADLEHKDERVARILDEQFRYKPEDWRGALVVSVTEAEPQALVHVPGPSIAPFAMSVGFLFVFASALLENLTYFLAGALITLVALIFWFLPQESEKRALAQTALQPKPDRLPLAIAGTQANGYWGTIVLIGVLVTALLTAVSSYFYLGQAGTPYPPRRPVAWLEPTLIIASCIAAAAVFAILLRWLRHDRQRGTPLALGSVLLLCLLCCWLLLRAYDSMALNAGTSAYGSSVVLLLGFQGLTMILLAVMTVTGGLWALIRPGDVRGQAVIWNTSLVAFFAAPSAASIVFCVFLSPYLW